MPMSLRVFLQGLVVRAVRTDKASGLMFPRRGLRICHFNRESLSGRGSTKAIKIGDDVAVVVIVLKAPLFPHGYEIWTF